MFTSHSGNAAPLLTRPAPLGCMLLLLAACKGSHYTYTFNDNVVYTPGQEGRQLTTVLNDAGLQACLNLLMDAGKIVDLAEVKLLACPGGGVTSLMGIEKLTALEQLEVSDNKITDLRPLGQLKNLRVVGLRNNPFTSIAPLMNLQLLRFVSLQGDELVPCKEVATLKAKLGNTLSEPLHCVQ